MLQTVINRATRCILVKYKITCNTFMLDSFDWCTIDWCQPPNVKFYNLYYCTVSLILLSILKTFWNVLVQLGGGSNIPSNFLVHREPVVWSFWRCSWGRLLWQLLFKEQNLWTYNTTMLLETYGKKCKSHS